MNSLIITGISGFVGTQLSAYMSGSHTILGMSLRGGVSSEKLPECEAIVHLAGKAHDTANTADASEYYKVNTDYTIALFDKFLKSEATVFIFISSVKAVADTVEGVLTEDHIASPKTPYGISKLNAEKYILSQKLPQDKKVYVLRPCMIHGPNNKGNLNLLYNLVSKGIPYPLGAYDNKRSFLHVNNLCTVIKELIIQKPDSAIFNVADDEAISTNELVSLIFKSLDKKVKILSIPKVFISFFGNIGSLLSLPINKEKLSKLTENYEVSNEKIKTVLGIKTKFSTTDGLLKTLSTFKKI